MKPKGRAAALLEGDGESRANHSSDTCHGSSVAYARKITEPHQVLRARGAHGVLESQLYADCFLCRQVMGCPFCSIYPICRNCLVVTEREYFVRNGPISNDSFSVAAKARGGRKAPLLREYPQSWQSDYIAAHPETAAREDEELYQEFKALFLKLTEGARMASRTLSDKQLERKLNRDKAKLHGEQWRGKVGV